LLDAFQIAPIAYRGAWHDQHDLLDHYYLHISIIAIEMLHL
jgi:hypothetical protein